MTDDLRTRIANAMRKEFYENEAATDDDATWVNWELMADAVIRELGLTEFQIEWPVRERWWATKTEPWEADDE